MFKQSTQYKNWQFEKQDQLDKLQITKFERGLKIISELNKDLLPTDINASQSEMIKDLKQSQHKISVNMKSKNTK